MSAEKREDLARTRQYNYKSGGWALGEETVLVRRGGASRGLGWLLLGLAMVIVVVMLGFLVWVCTGIWEDLGYMMEYGSICTEWDIASQGSEEAFSGD